MILNIKRTEIAVQYGVFIVDQTTACMFKAPPHSTLIRIKGKNPTGIDSFFPLVHPDTYASVTKFEFDDVDFSRIDDNNTVFDMEMARRMVDIFDEHKERQSIHKDALLVIHCQAGISRSSAVACGYAQYLDNRNLENAIRTGGFTPNARVFRCIWEEIQHREQFIRVKDLRAAIAELPEHAIVNVLFETSHTHYEQTATAVIGIKDGTPRLIISHELDLENTDVRKSRDYYLNQEQIGFCVLRDDAMNHGIDEPEVLKRYRQKIRKDWSIRYQMPVPKDCPKCDHTLLPEMMESCESGFRFYQWRCTRGKCEHNRSKDLVTKVECCEFLPVAEATSTTA